MRNFNINIKLFSLLLVVVWLGACQPLVTTERAAIIIFNDTNMVLGYEILLSGQWASRINVEAGKFDYAINYEAQPNEASLPGSIEQIKLVTPSCDKILQRAELEKNFKKDPAGRHNWDLHVSPQLLISLGCGKH